MTTLPKELKILLDASAGRTYPPTFNRRGLLGLVVGKLNQYAGDDARRRTFLKAAFGSESSKDLSDAQVMALNGWIEHPHARDDVNRIIAEYLTEQGQLSLC